MPVFELNMHKNILFSVAIEEFSTNNLIKSFKSNLLKKL